MKAVVLILDLTGDCNLRCEYCYASGGENQDCLSVDDAVLAIEKTYEKYECIVQTLFHGGEPMMCFEQICKIITMVKKKSYAKFVHWTIQTNGTLLTDEAVSYFAKNAVGVAISVDGATNISNATRPFEDQKPSTEKTLACFDILKRYNLPIHILSVINKHNYKSYPQDMENFIEMGATVFSSNPLIAAGRGAQTKIGIDTNELFELYKKITDVIIKYYNKNMRIFEKNIYHIVKQIVTEKPSYMCMAQPCGAGLAQVTISPKGLVYPCADFIGEDSFCLGNVKEDFFSNFTTNKKWLEIRQYSLDQFEKCTSCEIKNFCPAGCAVRCYFHNGKISSIDPLCDFYFKFISYLKEKDWASKLYALWN